MFLFFYYICVLSVRYLDVRDGVSVAVEGYRQFVILSLGSFQVHIPVNGCKSCGSYVIIHSIINTTDSVCVRKNREECASMCACVCILTGVFSHTTECGQKHVTPLEISPLLWHFP